MLPSYPVILTISKNFVNPPLPQLKPINDRQNRRAIMLIGGDRRQWLIHNVAAAYLYLSTPQFTTEMIEMRCAWQLWQRYWRWWQDLCIVTPHSFPELSPPPTLIQFANLLVMMKNHKDSAPAGRACSLTGLRGNCTAETQIYIIIIGTNSAHPPQLDRPRLRLIVQKAVSQPARLTFQPRRVQLNNHTKGHFARC